MAVNNLSLGVRFNPDDLNTDYTDFTDSLNNFDATHFDNNDLNPASLGLDDPNLSLNLQPSFHFAFRMDPALIPVFKAAEKGNWKAFEQLGELLLKEARGSQESSVDTFIKHYASSKNNLTGIATASDSLSGKRLEALLAVAPKIKRLLAIVSPKEYVAQSSYRYLEETGRKLGVQVIRRDATTEE